MFLRQVLNARVPSVAGISPGLKVELQLREEHPGKRRCFYSPRNSRVLDHIVPRNAVQFLKIACVCVVKLSFAASKVHLLSQRQRKTRLLLLLLCWIWCWRFQCSSLGCLGLLQHRQYCIYSLSHLFTVAPSHFPESHQTKAGVSAFPATLGGKIPSENKGFPFTLADGARLGSWILDSLLVLPDLRDLSWDIFGV